MLNSVSARSLAREHGEQLVELLELAGDELEVTLLEELADALEDPAHDADKRVDLVIFAAQQRRAARRVVERLRAVVFKLGAETQDDGE